MKETIEKVLETMRSAGKPVAAGEVATLILKTGLNPDLANSSSDFIT